jgi:hypothetical protein
LLGVTVGKSVAVGVTVRDGAGVRVSVLVWVAVGVIGV